MTQSNINKHNEKYFIKKENHMDTIPEIRVFVPRLEKLSTKELHLVRDLLAQQPEVQDFLRGMAAEIILKREETTVGDKVDHSIEQGKKMWNGICNRINNMRKKEGK